MIGTINVQINAARPNVPLTPLFAFKDSPSSLRILDVPKSIGSWEITSVKVSILYPTNQTFVKTATRSGNVWVATVNGSSSSGKVAKGYSIIADGKDEQNNDVTGYVLGKGDIFIMENDTDVARLADKYTCRFLNELPTNPTAGDVFYTANKIQIFDGQNWVYDVIPSKISDLPNDTGYITAEAIVDKRNYLDLSYNVSEVNTSASKYGIESFTIDLPSYSISRFALNNFSVSANGYAFWTSIDPNASQFFVERGANGNYYTIYDNLTQTVVAQAHKSSVPFSQISISYNDGTNTYEGTWKMSMMATTLATENYVQQQIGDVLNENF